MTYAAVIMGGVRPRAHFPLWRQPAERSDLLSRKGTGAAGGWPSLGEEGAPIIKTDMTRFGDRRGGRLTAARCSPWEKSAENGSLPRRGNVRSEG